MSGPISADVTALARALAKIAAGEPVARRRRHSPPKILETYADQCEAEGSPRNTVRNLRAAARRLRRAGLREPTREAVLLVRDYLLREAKLSRTTVQGYLDCAGAAWRWAHERGLVARPWPKIRALRKRDTLKRPYTVEEAQAVLRWFAERRAHLYPLIRLLWATGARSGEVLAMLGEDVDRERGVVVLRHTKSGEPRSVPVDPVTLEALPRRLGHLPLWIGPRSGRQLAHSTAKGALHRCLADLGLPREELDLHSFRRSYVQDAMRAGVPLSDSMAALGHKDLRVHVAYQRHALKDPERLRKGTSALRSYRKSDTDEGLGPVRTCGAGSRRVSAESESLEPQGLATRTRGTFANQVAKRLRVNRAAVRAPGLRGFLIDEANEGGGAVT